jgi:hypothetical protein
MQQVDDIGEQP